MTPHLELDYIVPPRQPRALGVAVLLIAIFLAAILVERYREVKLELNQIEAKQGLNVERRPTRTLPRERLDAEVKSTEAVLRQLMLPWSTIIEVLEAAAIPDVAILQMQPDAQQRQLRVGAEARDREAMLAYLRQLAASKALSDVHVVSHQVQMDDPQRPIQFTVQAQLRNMP